MRGVEVVRGIIAADRNVGQVIGLNDVTLTVPLASPACSVEWCGKSTSEAITGQLAPSKGTIRVLGNRSGAIRLVLRIGFALSRTRLSNDGLEWVAALVT